MSSKKWFGLVVAGAFCQAVVGVGCSSSSPANNGGSDSGTQGHDTGTGPSNDSGSGGDTLGSSDSLPPIDSGGGGGDSGGGPSCEMPPTGYTAMTYVAATANQGLCSATDISAFTAACGDSGSETACNTWQTANVKQEGGAGTACGNCIFAPMNNGGVWTDPEGYFEPNYGGCIQLTDATHGAACAAAFDAVSGCEGVACDACSGTDYSSCQSNVDGMGGGCSSFASTASSACMTDTADGGALSTCSPGAASMTQDPDFTYIIGLICGGADSGS
jgi:hypothetical protein